MKKIDLSYITTTNGMPIKSGSLLHLQSAYQEAISSAVQSIVFGSLYDSAVAYILHGCINSGSGTSYVISSGAVFFNGEVYQVDATSFTASGSNVPVGTITTTFFYSTNADPVSFTDGIARRVHQIRKVVFAAGLSGSGDFNFLDAVDLRYKPQGGIGQITAWKLPSGVLSTYFDGTGLGVNKLTLGWAIANGANGTTNFAGRVPVGYAVGDDDFGTVDGTGGAKTHTLDLTQIPAHTHEEKVYAATADGGSKPVGFLNTSPTLVNSGVQTGSAGGGLAHNNIQPYTTALFIQRIA